MIKYSFLLSFCNRVYDDVYNSFVSYVYHYSGRNDYEIIIVEDAKNVVNEKYHIELKKLIDEFKDKLPIVHFEYGQQDWYNHAPLLNEAARRARGTHYIITGPEMFHRTNALKVLDIATRRFPDTYIIGACAHGKSLGKVNNFRDFKYDFVKWHQHTKYRNRGYFFISCIPKTIFWDIGGLNEIFAKGFGSEDTEFIWRIGQNNVKTVCKDNIIVVHQAHGKFSGLPMTKAIRRRNSLLTRKIQGQLEGRDDLLAELEGYLKDNPI
jgi:hypothetical protein